MKALLVTIVVVGLGVWAVLHFGGTTSWDPAAQVGEFNKVAVEGATWQEIADFKEPIEYRKYFVDEEDGPGLAPEVKFDRAKFESRFDEGRLPEGFVFLYRFTAEDQFDLHFDADGKMTFKEKPVTMGGLLEGNVTPQMVP